MLNFPVNVFIYIWIFFPLLSTQFQVSSILSLLDEYYWYLLLKSLLYLLIRYALHSSESGNPSYLFTLFQQAITSLDKNLEAVL